MADKRNKDIRKMMLKQLLNSSFNSYLNLFLFSRWISGAKDKSQEFNGFIKGYRKFIVDKFEEDLVSAGSMESMDSESKEILKGMFGLPNKDQICSEFYGELNDFVINMREGMKDFIKE